MYVVHVSRITYFECNMSPQRIGSSDIRCGWSSRARWAAIDCYSEMIYTRY